jgi:sugar-specific transcriptional regulator TrmB
MDEKILEEVGLAKNEARVYMTLLRLGSASVGRVTEESGVHRRNVYDALERLANKGLVGHALKGETKFFEASDPLRLMELLNQKREAIDRTESRLKPILPNLKAIKGSYESQDVKIYRGKDSRRLVFEDILKSTKENRVLGAHTPSKLSRDYIMQWHSKRMRMGISDKLIYNKPDPWAKKMQALDDTEVRFAPEPIDSNTAINIYGSKVAMFLWSNDQPITILIDNEKIANDFRNYFNFLWSVAKEDGEK